MKKTRKIVVYIMSFILIFVFFNFNLGCSEKQGNQIEQGKNTYIYQPKENVVKDRQCCVEGDVRFQDELWQTPLVERVPDYDRYNETVKAYFLESVSYQGEKTKVFAFVGIPENASKDTPVPGIVLVYGGGGTAFPDWVKS